MACNVVGVAVNGLKNRSLAFQDLISVELRYDVLYRQRGYRA